MFKLYNRNPHNEKLSDCVCRAISLATGASYYDVMELLRLNSDGHECEELCVDCYGKMIDEIGYKRESGCNRTVKEIAEEHNMKTLILRIEGHLTCCINGSCYDLWDCTGETVDVYWIVE